MAAEANFFFFASAFASASTSKSYSYIIYIIDYNRHIGLMLYQKWVAKILANLTIKYNQFLKINGSIVIGYM